MRLAETITPISATEYQGFWGSFGDLIWWFLTIVIFISYFFVLFAVIGDLFRDREGQDAAGCRDDLVVGVRDPEGQSAQLSAALPLPGRRSRTRRPRDPH